MPSETGDEQVSEPPTLMENPERAPSGEKLRGDGDHGKENTDRGPSTASIIGDKEKEKGKKKSIKPDQEPFEAWEREEMERLLGELRGHLGESCCDIPSYTGLTHVYQSCIQHDSWKGRILPTISSSMQTDSCRYRFTTDTRCIYSLCIFKHLLSTARFLSSALLLLRFITSFYFVRISE